MSFEDFRSKFELNEKLGLITYSAIRFDRIFYQLNGREENQNVRVELEKTFTMNKYNSSLSFRLKGLPVDSTAGFMIPEEIFEAARKMMIEVWIKNIGYDLVVIRNFEEDS